MDATCSRCHLRPAGPGHRWCHECKNAAQRAWRRGRELTERERLRDNARSYAGVYLRRGKLTRGPCIVCSSPDAVMHHPDYSRPLDVIWMCRPHHRAEHKTLDALLRWGTDVSA